MKLKLKVNWHQYFEKLVTFVPENIHHVEVVLNDVFVVDTYDIFDEDFRGDNNVRKLDRETWVIWPHDTG